MATGKKLSMAPFDPSQGRKVRSVKATKVARMVKQRTGKFTPGTDIPQQVLQFAWVDPELVYINYERQRYPEPTHQKKLDRKWNTNVVTCGQARKDSEGNYFVADGQQHILVYINKYPGQPIPLFYVESDDPNVETEMLLALNVDSAPMAQYFIHEQHIKMGHEQAVEIERVVTSADCETGYKIRRPGSITHITDLYNSHEQWESDSLYTVLTRLRIYWPNEKIYTATMMGFLKVKQLLEDANLYTDDLMDDIFAECNAHFEDMNRLHLDIKDEFSQKYPTNYQGMANTEKVASGIINVYEKATGETLVPMPFPIDIPMMGDEDDIS